MTVITIGELKTEDILRNKNIRSDNIIFQVDIKTAINSLKIGIEYITDRFPLEEMSKELIEKFAATYIQQWLTNGDIEGLRHLAAVTFQEIYSGIFRSELQELFEPDEISYISMFC